MQKIFLIISIFFVILIGLGSYSFLKMPEYHPDYRYMVNPFIYTIYVISIFVDIFLIFLIILYTNIITFTNINKSFIRKLVIFFCIGGIILIWTEAFYSSIWYYGGIGNHQGMPLETNNLCFVGSILFSILIFTVIYFDKQKTETKKIYIPILVIITIFLLHYILYDILTPYFI